MTAAGIPVECSSALLRQLAYHQPEEFPALFDSAAEGALGRYSVLAAFPQGSLTLDADGVVQRTGRCAAVPMSAGPGCVGNSTGFLSALQSAWAQEAVAAVASAHVAGSVAGTVAATGAPALPFTGGWIVYLGYELAAEVEPTLRTPAAKTAAVSALALRIPAALVFDHASGLCHAVVEPQYTELLPVLLERVRQATRAVQPPFVHVSSLSCVEEPPELFIARVQHAQQYIRAGDVYQVNLSRAWQLELAPGTQVAALYEQLRRHNPAPFAALLHTGATTLLSSSPERLVSVREGRVATRPIAGTRPRIGGDADDKLERSELIGHPKERAEHVMLIDLERNDLGKLCEPGSVQVDEFMVLESYAHVHHIVSGVSGRLRTGIQPADVLRAVFPGGTITGCPKFRCMQIIGELEGEPRGAYTGALGYLNHDASMDFNILIRTLEVQGERASFRAGAGIVADSEPARELQETRAKARGLLHALGVPA